MDEERESDPPHVRRVPEDPDSIATFLGKLLGCSVAVTPAEPLDATAQGVVAGGFVDRTGRLAALLLCDVDAAVALVMAVSVFDADQGRAALRERRVPDIFREHLYGTYRFFGSLFSRAPASAATTANVHNSQLSLRELTEVEHSPADVVSLIHNCRSRIDVSVSVAAHGTGRLALLARSD